MAVNKSRKATELEKMATSIQNKSLVKARTTGKKAVTKTSSNSLAKLKSEANKSLVKATPKAKPIKTTARTTAQKQKLTLDEKRAGGYKIR